MKIKNERLANIIKKNIAEIIQFQLKDPSIGFVTITDVQLTSDNSLAKIYVMFLGQNPRKEAGINALKHSKGFLRTELGKTLSIRKVPDLMFILDESLDKANRIDEIIKKAFKE
jgi:ribosome-binding factor A